MKGKSSILFQTWGFTAFKQPQCYLKKRRRKRKKLATTGRLRYHSRRAPCDERLFLAAVSSFASSTREIVSPSAEELCGTLGTGNREIATRKTDSKRQRERQQEKERNVVGRSSLVDLCLNNGKRIPNNNFCSYIKYIYPRIPACHCELSSWDNVSPLPKSRGSRRVGFQTK